MRAAAKAHFSPPDCDLCCAAFSAGETAVFGVSLDCAETVIAPTVNATAKITLIFIFTRFYWNRSKRFVVIFSGFCGRITGVRWTGNRNRTCGNEGAGSKITYQYEILF
ncbi:hypothetical protein [Mesorhizobium sp. J18]|uniref:hypothetical protein n=1 Tax=Mesorhizobium sp. J18 TaxID=935263 RepID=UPI001FEDA151|nr:hypothetical protein [Mesorhizobium sp. J18]